MQAPPLSLTVTIRNTDILKLSEAWLTVKKGGRRKGERERKGRERERQTETERERQTERDRQIGVKTNRKIYTQTNRPTDDQKEKGR